SVAILRPNRHTDVDGEFIAHARIEHPQWRVHRPRPHRAPSMARALREVVERHVACNCVSLAVEGRPQCNECKSQWPWPTLAAIAEAVEEWESTTLGESQ